MPISVSRSDVHTNIIVTTNTTTVTVTEVATDNVPSPSLDASPMTQANKMTRDAVSGLHSMSSCQSCSKGSNVTWAKCATNKMRRATDTCKAALVLAKNTANPDRKALRSSTKASQ